MKPTLSLFVAWHCEQPSPRWGPIGRVDGLRVSATETRYRFCCTQGARLIEGFRPFDGMEDLELVYRSDALLPMLANRVLSESRPEYADFLRWHGFDPADPPEPLLLLQRSEGSSRPTRLRSFLVPSRTIRAAT